MCFVCCLKQFVLFPFKATALAKYQGRVDAIVDGDEKLARATRAHGAFRNRVFFIGSFATNKDMSEDALTLNRGESAARSFCDAVALSLFGRIAREAGILLDLFPSRLKAWLKIKANNYKEPKNLTLFMQPLIDFIQECRPDKIIFIAASSARIMAPLLRKLGLEVEIFEPVTHGSSLSDNRVLERIRVEAATQHVQDMTAAFHLGSFLFPPL